MKIPKPSWGYSLVPNIEAGTWCIFTDNSLLTLRRFPVKVIGASVTSEGHLWYDCEMEDGEQVLTAAPEELRVDTMRNGVVMRTLRNECPCCGHGKDAL